MNIGSEKKVRFAIVFFLLVFCTIGLFVVNILTGPVKISFFDAIKCLFGFDLAENKQAMILWKIRIPRTCMVFILGGALALSGFLLQTYFQNPIAGPYVLGISSGAKMVLAFVLVISLKFGIKLNSWLMIAAASAGALLATAYIVFVGRRISSSASLLVAGIMFGYIAGAITDLIISFADDSDIVNLHNWSQGSFSGMSMSDCSVAFLVVGICLLCVMLLAKPIYAYQLGENYARSLGVNTSLCRILIILFSSILSSTVVAFAGPVSFVGIAVPFLIKQALGSNKALFVIPASFFGGSVFCLFCDLICRIAISPAELKIGIVTSLLGAPIVLVMLVKSKWR